MRRTTGDEGFTLVETVVAMLVFAILSSGVIASTITISRMTADNRSRIVATDLAAQATDAVRLAGDPFSVYSGTTTQTVGGRTYTVARAATWVGSSGTDATCGSATNLQYKRITVTVTWAGMAVTTQPVRSDTLLASTTKVTDASTGAILVSVLDSTGAGESGVSVAIAPGSTGTALTSQPGATDADGCTYATQVVPGTYTVTASRTGFRDNKQAASPVSTVSVTAGSTVTAAFQYDAAAALTIVHAANAPSVTTVTPLLPTNLQTTLVPVGGTSTVYPVLTSNAATSASVWPVSSGYTAIAGSLTDVTGNTTRCASFDPGAWPAGMSGATSLPAGARAAGAPASPGGSATVNEKMGILTVTASDLAATAGSTLTATPVNPTTTTAGGNPGCASPPTPLTFGGVLVRNGTITIALPYGAWTLSSSSTTALASAKAVSNFVGNTTVVNATGSGTTAAPKTIAVTLDPRAAR